MSSFLSARRVSVVLLAVQSCAEEKASILVRDRREVHKVKFLTSCLMKLLVMKRIQSDVRHHSAIQQVYMRLLGLASSDLPSSCWASLSRLHSLCSACCSNTCHQSCAQLSFIFCGEVMNAPWSRSSLLPAVSGKWLQEGWHNLAYAVLLHRNWQRLQRR